MYRHGNNSPELRRGSALVWVSIVLVLVFAFAAFTVDVGYLAITKTELQAAADASALGSVVRLADGSATVKAEAKRIASANKAGEQSVNLTDADIVLGKYEMSTKTFTTPSTNSNAVRVTTWRKNNPMIFGAVLGKNTQDQKATALAMLNPRDIVFVIDLSGSMNDDTEPCWATDAINAMYGPAGYPSIGNTLMQNVFDDFGFGTFPGAVTTPGAPLGVVGDQYAYAELTRDEGPLTSLSIPAMYRINDSDSEEVRRDKAYRWIIDYQIASSMPAALPTPNSTTNFGYWAAYIDYIIQGTWVGDPNEAPESGGSSGGGGGPSGPTPPPIGYISPNPLDLMARRQSQKRYLMGPLASVGAPTSFGATDTPTPGTPRQGTSEFWKYLPMMTTSNQIYRFNNPSNAFTSASVPWGWQNKIGYITYVQFMMDFGRDRSPDISNSYNADPLVGTKTPLSADSPDCPRRTELVDGLPFSFPPRAQPMHSLRRALISGISLISQRNAGIALGDRVSIVTFDARDAYHTPQIRLALTNDYTAAMQACTDLQGVADIGTSTSTDSGVILARQHLTNKSASNNPSNLATGPQGRTYADKVIILLTDGLPNSWETTATDISSHIAANPSSDFYAPAYEWFNSVLVQTSMFQKDKGQVFPVGMGLGTDYDFLDRVARVATSDVGGLSPRGTGNPAEYEATLRATLEEIIKNPGSRLME